MDPPNASQRTKLSHLSSKVRSPPLPPPTPQLNQPHPSGVIERRKVYRQNTDYGATADPTPAPHPTSKAFAKVKIKGGGVPERRSAFVARAEGPLEEAVEVAPLYYGSPSGDSGMLGREEDEEEREAGETSPLIGKN